MAFMNQVRKAELAKEIAKVIPPNWKYTLAVRHHSTLVLTIRQADVDLLSENLVVRERNFDSTCRHLNEHNLSGEYEDKLLKIFESIKGAMNVGNWDKSDIQSDYFDVGWYIDINIGDSDSPFRYVSTKPVCEQRQVCRLSVREIMRLGKARVGTLLRKHAQGRLIAQSAEQLDAIRIRHAELQ